MKIVSLAKELGIPDERLLAWCRKAGLPYQDPEDEVDPAHSDRARSVFARASRGEGPRKDADADLPEDWMGDDDLNLEGIPQSLEELEAFEREVFNRPLPGAPPPKKKDRTAVAALLERYGLEDRSTAKKIRKLLPDHISRLLNHESLAEDQALQLIKGIEEKLLLCCGNPTCRDLLVDRFGEKALIMTRSAGACRLCGGSSIRRAMEEMAVVCREAGVSRILIVGGAPASHNELKRNQPPGIEFRLIEGNLSRDRQRAAADLKWSDVAVIWAGTILGHDVSNQYISARKDGATNLVWVRRRSIEALCETVVQHIRKDLR